MKQAEAGYAEQGTQQALLPVVEGCRLQVELLNDMLMKIAPKVGESIWERRKKAPSSIGQDGRVGR